MMWQDQAACAGLDGDLFFPFGKDQSRLYEAALEVCAECPVKAECLAFAVENRERWGVWGGVVFDPDWRRRRHHSPLPKPEPECGTRMGYRRHRAAGEPACTECKRAEAKYQANLVRRRKEAS